MVQFGVGAMEIERPVHEVKIHNSDGESKHRKLRRKKLNRLVDGIYGFYLNACSFDHHLQTPMHSGCIQDTYRLELVQIRTEEQSFSL